MQSRPVSEPTSAQRFSRGLLGLNVILFAAFGFAFLVLPEFFARLVTGSAPEGLLAVDARATYGGMALGLGWVLWAALRGDAAAQRLGQAACAVTYALVAFGRLTGMVAGNLSSPLMDVLLAGEIVFALLSWYALGAIDRT